MAVERETAGKGSQATGVLYEGAVTKHPVMLAALSVLKVRFKVCRGACRFCNRELAAAHYADAMGGMSESLHHCPAVAYAERTSPESLPLYRSDSRQMELVAELLDVHRSRPHDEP